MTAAAYAALDYNQLIDRIMEYGDRVVVNDQVTYELIDAKVETPIGHFPWRKGLAKKLIVAEALQMIAGTFDYHMLVLAAPRADHSLFTPIMAYGPRIKHGLAATYRTLKKDPASRRAVALIGKPSDKGAPTTPCTISMQFLIRDGRLHCIVPMRSWDAAYGLPYDLAVFGAVAMTMAKSLGVIPGMLSVTAGSLHVYEATANLTVGEGVGLVECLERQKSWPSMVKAAELAMGHIHSHDRWDTMFTVRKER